MNKSSLSANTLFHFTSKLDYIINILTNDFTPRYCMESFNYLSVGGNPLEIALPMVCFCDIPLSQIRNHIENYGGYAIGLSKEWGISNGINPVLYSLPNSFSTLIIKQFMEISNNQIQILNEIASTCEGKLCIDKNLTIERLKTSIQEINTSNVLQFNFTNYMKPYEGCAWNMDAFNGDFVRFYDEREWRFVPSPYLLWQNNIPTYLTKDQFLDENLRTNQNHEIGKVATLLFTPNDIKYIIVNSEDEILKICDQIDYIKGDKYSQNQLKLLKTRIISKEQILQDF